MKLLYNLLLFISLFCACGSALGMSGRLTGKPLSPRSDEGQLQFEMEELNSSHSPHASKIQRSPVKKVSLEHQQEKENKQPPVVQKSVVIPLLALQAQTIQDQEHTKPVDSYNDPVVRLSTMLEMFKHEKYITPEDYALLVHKHASCLPYLDKKLALKKLNIYMNARYWDMLACKHGNKKDLLSPTAVKSCVKFYNQESDARKVIASFVADVQQNVGNICSRDTSKLDEKTIEEKVVRKITPRENEADLDFSRLSFDTSGALPLHDTQDYKHVAPGLDMALDWLYGRGHLGLATIEYLSHTENFDNLVEDVIDQNNFQYFARFLIHASKYDKGPLLKRDEILLVAAIEKVVNIINDFVENQVSLSYSDEFKKICNVIENLGSRNLLNSSVCNYLQDLKHIKALSDKLVDQHRYYIFKSFVDILKAYEAGKLSEKEVEAFELQLKRAIAYIEEAVTELQK